jgi:cytochrome c
VVDSQYHESASHEIVSASTVRDCCTGGAVISRLVLMFSVVLAAAATGAAALAQYLAPTFDIVKAEQVAGRKLFSDHCAICHATGHSRAYGPDLRDVVGRPAAATSDFRYSDALKKSGLTWTEDNLRSWIADPAHMVPSTLMPHPAISDPAEQIYVVAYLKTLKAPARR